MSLAETEKEWPRVTDFVDDPFRKRFKPLAEWAANQGVVGKDNFWVAVGAFYFSFWTDDNIEGEILSKIGLFTGKDSENRPLLSVLVRKEVLEYPLKIWPPEVAWKRPKLKDTTEAITGAYESNFKSIAENSSKYSTRLEVIERDLPTDDPSFLGTLALSEEDDKQVHEVFTALSKRVNAYIEENNQKESFK